MKKRNYVVLSAAGLAAACFLTACGSTGAGNFGVGAGGNGGVIQIQNVENQVISVSSREEVKVTPDMAEVVYSIYTQKEDAKECQEKNQADVEKVRETLMSMGLEEKSVQASDYSMNPIYNWDEGQKVIGYEMETSITVSDIPAEKVGEIITGSVNAGVNNIRSVTYMCSSYDEAYQEALKKAVESAREKARVMAEAGNSKLGKLVRIQEYSSSQEARYTNYAVSGMAKEEAAIDGAGAAMASMPGEVSVEAYISAEFAVE